MKKPALTQNVSFKKGQVFWNRFSPYDRIAGEPRHRSTAATAPLISAVRLIPAKAPVVGSTTV